MKIPLVILFCLIIFSYKIKNTINSEPFYIYENIKKFDSTLKDSTKRILILWDSYGSSIKYAYSNWLLSSQVNKYLEKDYAVFIFNYEHIYDSGTISRADYKHLKKYNPDLKFPFLVLIDNQRRIHEVPYKYYFHNKDSTAILDFLKLLPEN